MADAMEKAIDFIVKILPDGDVMFLYNDDSPLRDLGRMNLQRASNVEWDHIGQYWVIYMIDPATGKKESHFLSQTFESRADAIQYEIEMLNAQLLEGVPAEQIFKSYASA